MFELKQGQDYSVFNKTTTDMFNWKKYNVDKSLLTNRHKMAELKLNITDAVLLGSANSVALQPEVLSRF